MLQMLNATFLVVITHKSSLHVKNTSSEKNTCEKWPQKIVTLAPISKNESTYMTQKEVIWILK